MTDPQEKSIELWRDRCFKLYWKLRAAQDRIEKLEAALHGVIAVAGRDTPEFRLAREVLGEKDDDAP